MSMLPTHTMIAVALLAGAVLCGALALRMTLEARAARRAENEFYRGEVPGDTMLLTTQDPWDGSTFAYPQSWGQDWPEDMTVTQFLDSVPAETTPQPVVGIWTGAQAAASDVDEWILQMYADTDKFIAQMNAPLTATAWR